jgi:hypothetical protein
MNSKPQCAAITTTYNTQCLRRAKKGYKYCWQHLDYKPRVVSHIKKPEPVVESVVELDIESESGFLYLKYLNNIDGTIDNSENSEDYMYSPYTDKIVGYGPFTINLPVGRYPPTIVYISIPFDSERYTYKELLQSIRQFYNSPISVDLLNKLIKLARINKDMLSEGLYVGLKTRIKIEPLQIYDLNNDYVYFNRIFLENKDYYLELGN